MEYIYAALILHSTGKEITEDGIINIVKAAGVEPEEVRAKALVSALEGVDIEEAISKAAVSAPVVQAAAPEVKAESETPSEVVEEKKEEEKKKEEAEESGMAGLGALFG